MMQHNPDGVKGMDLFEHQVDFINVLIQREKVNTILVAHWLARPVQAIRGL